MEDKTNLHCSFCGKARDDVDKLIAGPNVYICNECVVLSYNIVVKENVTEKNTVEFENLPKPSQIKQYLDEYIIGHHDTKELLSVSAYNHYKRVFNHSETEIDKSNVLLIGATGTGKTLFARTLANKLHVPFAIADATTLTEAGYVGEDVESVLERLLSVADYDLELAQKGIVYIDEIDKKARKGQSNSSTRDVSGEGVQQALLRLVEGSVIKIKSHNNGKKYGNDEYIEFDTKDVLFIVGGAFVGLEDIIKKRTQKSSSIGFGSELKTDHRRDFSALKRIKAQDVTEFGLIPELMGRLPVIAVLDKFTENDLSHIMTNVKNSIVSQYKELFIMDELELELEQEFIDDVAKCAFDEKLGARGLRGLLENALVNVMYRAPELKKNGVTKVKFNKYPISKDLFPLLIDNNGEGTKDENYRLYRGLNEK